MLDIKQLQKQLEIDEGVKYYIYLDSLGLPTFGIGHLLTPKDPEFDLWQKRLPSQTIYITKERVAEVFQKDCEIVLTDCCSYINNFVNYPEEVKQIIANMMFNLGLTKMRKMFQRFRLNILNHNYKMAAFEMQYNDGSNHSKGECDWVKQTKGRAYRLIKRMHSFADSQLCNV